MIRKSTVVWGALLLSFLVALGTAAGVLAFVTHRNAALVEKAAEGTRNFAALSEVMDIIQEDALETYSDEELMNAALKGLSTSFGDKYAYYYTQEEYQEYIQEEEGSYVGIGVSIQQDLQTGIVTVTTVFDGAPAYEAGVKPGDILTHVDGMSIEGMDTTMIASHVKGEEGTVVDLTFLRKGEEIVVPVMRRQVTTKYLSSSLMNGNMGYIRILEFSGSVAEDFDRAVEQLLAQGAQGFILDLRNNPGGGKDIVVKIADRLMPEGPIITLEDRNGKTHTDMSDAAYLGLPVVVLVNEYSASASELLSGSLQDTQMATIVGVTTFGKGSAQMFYETSDKAMMKLTTCRYLTASGRCPQDVGVTPDLVVEASDELKESWLFGSEEDNQLQEAVNMLRRKMAS